MMVKSHRNPRTDNKLWPAYKVCTRCYARYPAGDAACPQCRNPEFALPGTDADRVATLRAEGALTLIFQEAKK